METSTSSSRLLPLVCASLAIAFGLLTLVGWISGLSILASVRAKYIPMAPSTALCFSLIAVSLIQQLMRPALCWLACLVSAIEQIRKFSKREAFDDDVCALGVEVRRTS
jgi:hypothetical protein